ncbi:S49 family peptidase [Piscinibacter sakaiensis]|uniref:S49 family peptidase n=1 Tax=Piscinibacter sakaiensis TaxID=1547922 RepID=UPI003AACBE93
MSSSDNFPPTAPPSLDPPQSAGPRPSSERTGPPPWSGVDHVVEQFARDYLKDRRSERRWRVFFRLAWLAFFVFVFWALLAARNNVPAPSGKHTALIEVRGEISTDSEASAEQLVGALKSAFEDRGSQAIVLRFNSPGGSPVQAGIINDEIKRLKQLHNKKVYAVIEEMCASGAYYIAVAADEIFTDKASIVGSIGVLMDGFGFPELMDKVGVERRLIIAGENKAMNDPFLPQNERQRAYAQQMIDQIHAQFITVVREGRGERLKETTETFSGLYWNGEQAVQNGLADRLGNLDFVAREVVKAEEIIDYTPHENVAERLAKRFGASIGAGAVKALQGLGGIR